MEELSFEDALQRLEAIVQQLERGDVPLAKSITALCRGRPAARACQKRLEAAQARIEQIVGGAEGTADKTIPFPAS